MDLGLHLRVVWRFRGIVLTGVVLASLLAFLSYARVSFAGGPTPRVTYRQTETWRATTRLLISQPGFPQGQVSGSSLAGSLAALSPAYEILADSDAVQRLVRANNPAHGVMSAAAEYSPQNQSQPLPILDINGLAHTPQGAIATAQHGAAVFMRYFRQQQATNGVPLQNRVKLVVLNRTVHVEILVKRKKTLPIVVFATVLIAALGLAFILENLRPRIRVVPAEAVTEGRVREQIGA